MRIRTVKPELFIHAELADLEREVGLPVRLSFIGLFCAADRDGRFKWNPRRLGVQILPYDDVDFEVIMDALESNNFIERYEVEGKTYGCIPSFSKHQVINNRELDSIIPSPDGTIIKAREEEKTEEVMKEISLPFDSTEFSEAWQRWNAVSYTHLTLPTTPYV